MGTLQSAVYSPRVGSPLLAVRRFAVRSPRVNGPRGLRALRLGISARAWSTVGGSRSIREEYSKLVKFSSLLVTALCAGKELAKRESRLELVRWQRNFTCELAGAAACGEWSGVGRSRQCLLHRIVREPRLRESLHILLTLLEYTVCRHRLQHSALPHLAFHEPVT